MARLIVVSNRVNPPADAGTGTAGGLAMALAAALKEDQGLWFGWSGRTTEHFTGQISLQRIGDVTVALVDLEEQDRDTYYNGYANKTLWPLFHYRTDLMRFERSFEDGYERVNRRFAETLVPLLAPDDLIWVQDYHLIPLARYLREKGVRNRIGFFLHIPWPARRIFTSLPRHRELVDSMFDYDLLGFQTEDHRGAFLDYVLHEFDVAPDERDILNIHRTPTCVKTFPIGLDTESFEIAVQSAQARTIYHRMRASQNGRKLLLGIDRLDYSKGLEERFHAYDTLLADHPDLHEQIFFLQIAPHSREDVEAYQNMRSTLETISGQINGAYSTFEWVPLRYVNRSYRRDELAGMYRAADVALVTPLRDGMNLVAKEYVAAQDPEAPGVLILSQFAGAAEQMQSALIVNPLSREDMSEAMRRALAMPLEERRARWQDLISNVRRYDVIDWRDSFVSALRDCAPLPELADP